MSMQLAECQRLMRDTYLQRDKDRGELGTYQWLVEEVGELGKALRQGNDVDVEEEMGDVLAWLCSLANLRGVDLGKAFAEKYPGGCSRCGNVPCGCG